MAIVGLANAKQALSAASQLPWAAGVQISLGEIQAFNYSVEFKLECAEHYLSQLKEELEEISAHALGRGGGPNLFLVNLYLDGFLSSAASASDVFGREINLYFGKIMTDPRFYLFDVLTRLRNSGRGTRLVNHLLPAVDPNVQPKPLVPLLKTYRNCSMHSRLIETATVISATITYAAQKTGTTPSFTPACYLPDDPESFPCSYDQKIEALGFCESTLIDLVKQLDGAYLILHEELTSTTRLPL